MELKNASECLKKILSELDNRYSLKAYENNKFQSFEELLSNKNLKEE